MKPKIYPIQTGKTISDCWVRVQKTKPDNDADPSRGVVRVGPNKRFRNTLIETIRNAEETIIASTFLFADDELEKELLDAAERHVRIYLLTASDAQISNVRDREDEDSFESIMIEKHKRALDRFAGQIMLRSAGFIHSKFLIVGPRDRAHGWISTANFNLALQQSIELGLYVKEEQAQAVWDWFAWVFWESAEFELLSKGSLNKVKSPPIHLPIPSTKNARILVTANNGPKTIYEEAKRLIQRAKKEIVISSYGLSSKHLLFDELVQKAEEGVEVTILTRPRKAVHEAVSLLKITDAKICAHEKLHAKAIVSDAGGMVMSANLEERGLDSGFEIGLSLTQEQCSEVRKILCTWEREFPWQYELEYEPTLGQKTFEVCEAAKGLPEGMKQVEISEHTEMETNKAHTTKILRTA